VEGGVREGAEFAFRQAVFATQGEKPCARFHRGETHLMRARIASKRIFLSASSARNSFSEMVSLLGCSAMLIVSSFPPPVRPSARLPFLSPPSLGDRKHTRTVTGEGARVAGLGEVPWPYSTQLASIPKRKQTDKTRHRTSTQRVFCWNPLALGEKMIG